MHNQVLYSDRSKLENNPYRLQSGELVSVSSIQACFNNDFLLKYHNVSFAGQLSIMALKGVNINRHSYYRIRSGEKIGVNTLYLGYILNFWITEYKYRITFHQFQSETFQDLFLSKIKPERDAAI